MRRFAVAWVAACILSCSSSGSSFGNGRRPVSDAGLSSGGASGCTVDTECKGARVCQRGRCVDPGGAGGTGTGGAGAGTGARTSTGGRFPVNGGSAGVYAGGGAATDAAGSGAGGIVGIGGADASAGAQPGTGGGYCGALQIAPESVVVYRDATVTNTVYTSKPVALFFMMDRSGSMVTGVPAGSAQSWSNLTAGITAFVNDPRNAGVDVGLGTFPVGPNNTADCAGSDCGHPIVAFAPLPQNASTMIQAMQAQTPSSPVALAPTECGLRGMIDGCLQFMASSSSGEQCVGILVTDGAPTQCTTDQASLTAIVADGHSKGVMTFALGLAGADLTALDQFATAGGTNAAIDVSGGAQAVIDALNEIRQMVAVTTANVVTTQTVVATPLPCEFMIPAAPQGGLDFGKLNVTLATLGSTETLRYVASAADCGLDSGRTWYFDNPQSPTRLILCPATCSRAMNARASIGVALGCPRISAP